MHDFKLETEFQLPMSFRTGVCMYPATPSVFGICAPSFRQAAHKPSWDWRQIPRNAPGSTLHNTVYRAPSKDQPPLPTISEIRGLKYDLVSNKIEKYLPKNSEHAA